MNFHSLFLELKKICSFKYVTHKILSSGVDTAIVLKNVQTDEEIIFTFPNARARLFLRTLGLVEEYRDELLDSIDDIDEVKKLEGGK